MHFDVTVLLHHVSWSWHGGQRPCCTYNIRKHILLVRSCCHAKLSMLLMTKSLQFKSYEKTWMNCIISIMRNYSSPQGSRWTPQFPRQVHYLRPEFVYLVRIIIIMTVTITYLAEKPRTPNTASVERPFLQLNWNGRCCETSNCHRGQLLSCRPSNVFCLLPFWLWSVAVSRMYFFVLPSALSPLTQTQLSSRSLMVFIYRVYCAGS